MRASALLIGAQIISAYNLALSNEMGRCSVESAEQDAASLSIWCQCGSHLAQTLSRLKLRTTLNKKDSVRWREPIVEGLLFAQVAGQRVGLSGAEHGRKDRPD